MELFPFTLPKSSICVETELYYRSNKEVSYEECTGRIAFERDTVLTFDTYFNCFSYQKYVQYTNAKTLEIQLKLQGKLRLRLLKAEMTGDQIKRTELRTCEIQHEELEETTVSYDFSSEKENGFFYLEITALTDAVFAGGCYSTPVAEEDLNNVKMAAVICTYHREQYVWRNLDYFVETIFKNPERKIAERLEIFVVDNGGTLKAEDIENTHVKLFANKNYGGSGGFARGMIEALRDKEKFSHILLMDDDILLESNVLFKTICFLKLLRQEHQGLVIGASMLCLDNMAMQNEAGARWSGIRILQGNHDIDLRSVESLLKNEDIKMPQYTAWWYCCIPLDLIDETQLPMPFFIKMDDIEYSLRRFREILIINGIGIWHEVYEKKQTAWLDYYNLRNKLVLNTIYEKQFTLAKNIFLLGCYIGRTLLNGAPMMAEFSIEGCYDYLKGIEFFKTVEGNYRHKELLVNYQRLLQDRRSTIYYWVQAIKEYLLLTAKLIFNYNKLKQDYKTKPGQITSADYWTEKLGIKSLPYS